MKLYSWNINGVRAVMNKDALIPFIKKHQPDVLCLQETKAQPEQIELDLDEYETFVYSAERKGYSGTAILTKETPIKVTNGLPEEIINKFNISDDGYGDPSKEGRVMVAEFEKFNLMTVYTPNSKDDLSRIPLRHKHWDPAFLAYAQELEKTKPVIFCGDLNVAHTEDDLARPKENVGKKGFTEEEREGFDRFLKAGYIDTLRLFKKGNGFYTWWTFWAKARERNVGWRIDYFLASKKLKSNIKNAEIHPDVMGSDHCPVSLTLDL